MHLPQSGLMLATGHAPCHRRIALSNLKANIDQSARKGGARHEHDLPAFESRHKPPKESCYEWFTAVLASIGGVN
jgi:hypothetical protein